MPASCLPACLGRIKACISKDGKVKKKIKVRNLCLDRNAKGTFTIKMVGKVLAGDQSFSLSPIRLPLQFQRGITKSSDPQSGKETLALIQNSHALSDWPPSDKKHNPKVTMAALFQARSNSLRLWWPVSVLQSRSTSHTTSQWAVYLLHLGNTRMHLKPPVPFRQGGACHNGQSAPLLEGFNISMSS